MGGLATIGAFVTGGVVTGGLVVTGDGVLAGIVEIDGPCELVGA